MTHFRWLSLFALLALWGCGFSDKEPVASAPFPSPIECRSVKLFDKNMEPPSSSIPDEWRVFAGHWGNGAWDGKLCHEIVVEAIYPDGTARVVEMQGDYQPWNRWPTAFRREGRFLSDGSLMITMNSGATMVYRYEGGIIYGVWNWGAATGKKVGVTLHPV